MTTFEQILIYGLASIHAEKTGSTVQEVIRWWTDGAQTLWPSSSPKRTDSDAVEEVYKAYPSKDPNNGNRPTSKGQKDRNTIRRLLTDGEYTKDQLLTLIRREVEDRMETGAYLRNFSTFLNNLPDIEDEDQQLFKPTRANYE